MYMYKWDNSKISGILFHFLTGFELTFFSGVYGTSVGHTHAFGSDAKSYLALCGIFIGLGEILGKVTILLLVNYLESKYCQLYRNKNAT